MEKSKLTEEEIEAFKNLIPVIMEVSEVDWKYFMEMLENPPEPNEALKELMRNYDE
jgi:uncharacterized protein (DUF1778 family)